MARKPLPTPISGNGALVSSGGEQPVRYTLASPASALRLGRAVIRGHLETEPDLAQALFRQGDACLRLEDGSRYRLTILAHTQGSGAAYFEMRV